MQYFTHQNCIPIILTSLLALGFFLVLPLTVAAQTTWNDTEWTVYDTITIDATQIDDDLTDFPVYVDLADLSSRFWSTTPSGSTTVGTDIRVTTGTSSAYELPRELVAASSTAQTGELHFKADSISSTTDTVFRIYYNGTTTGDYATSSTYGAENVWTNGYLLVTHLEETGDGTVGEFKNSVDFSTNGRGGSGNSANTPSINTSTTLLSGTSQRFDGTDFINFGDNFDVTGAFTISAWVNPTSVSMNGGRVAIKDTAVSGSGSWALSIGDAATPGNLRTFMRPIGGSVVADSVEMSTGSWQYISSKYTGSVLQTYYNGSSVASIAAGGPANTAASFGLGGDPAGSSGVKFEGYMDEARVASTSRSAAWIAAEYTNQSTTTDFYTAAAAAVEWNATDWTTYDTITIKHENIDESLTDFPVYVDLADLSASFWATTPTSSALVGTDIRVTTDDATPVELPRELVAASSTAETGELHFKADFLNKDADTTFRIYYNGDTAGDYTSDAMYGAQNVWTNGYLAVYHMNSVNPLDSTSNSKDGVEVGSIGADSFMGDALDFDGTSDYVDLQDTFSELSGGSTMAVSMWVNADSNAVDQWAFGLGDNTVNDPIMLWYNLSGTTGDDTYTFNVGTTGTAGNRADGVDNAALSNTWQHVVGIMDGGAREMYIDGGLSNSNTGGTTTISNFSDNAFIALWDTTDKDRLFNGSIDEVRISSSTRSAAWINAEYLNQSTTTDFYALGAGTSGTGSTTLSDHDATQVDDAFNFMNKTNEPLFAFKLTPQSGTSTITELTLELRGATAITVSDFSNITLYRDHDNDALYDATDTAVGTGVMTLGNRGRAQNENQIGTIVFAEDFLSTTTQNYLVVADWNYPERGSSLTINLHPEDIEAVDTDGAHVFSGSVDHVQHSRNNRGGGGGSSAAVGTPAPAGDGDVFGGGSGGGGAINTNTGGDTIGTAPDFFWPTAGSGDWQSIANAYDQVDGTYATTGAASSSDLSAFNDSVPGSDTIEGIAVKLEGAHITAGEIAVELSFDGGSTYTSSGKTLSGLSGTDQVVTLGGPSDLWGRSWTSGEFSDANFRVRITGNSLSGGEVRLDALQVRVYHQASGGSSGGGGAI